MILKEQTVGYSAFTGTVFPRMSLPQRALCRWATLEEYDRVLDMDCGDGALLGGLDSGLRLTLCGLCDSPEQARATRDALENADVTYARPGDIPFRDASFDVLFDAGHVEKLCSREELSEALRVLRPGGQLLAACRPFGNWGVGAGEGALDRRSLMRRLQEAGFCQVSFRRHGLVGVVVAWKKASLAQNKN